MIVPSIVKAGQSHRHTRSDRQTAQPIAHEKTLSMGCKSANVSARCGPKEITFGGEPVQSPAAWRGNRDLRVVPAEGDAARIAPHGQFVGQGRCRQRWAFTDTVQPQKRRRRAGRALPLYRKSDKAVLPDGKVTDRVSL